MPCLPAQVALALKLLLGLAVAHPLRGVLALGLAFDLAAFLASFPIFVLALAPVDLVRARVNFHVGAAVCHVTPRGVLRETTC
jgi:hypothetical protein